MADTSIYKKLAKFQTECPPIKKETENPFFKSSYAELSGIVAIVNPVLNKNGLVITQAVEGDKVITTLTDVDTAEHIVSNYPIITKDVSNPQQYGAGVTYARRYSLTALLGIVAEDDDDGNTATGIKHEAKPQETTKTEIKKPFKEWSIEEKLAWAKKRAIELGLKINMADIDILPKAEQYQEILNAVNAKKKADEEKRIADLNKKEEPKKEEPINEPF